MASVLPPAQVIEEFRQRRKRQWLSAIPGVLSMLLLLWTLDRPDAKLLGANDTTLTILAAVVLLAYVVFSIRNWRCPACESYLGKNLNPAFCPKCGARLREAKTA